MNAIARHYQRVKNGIHALQAVIIFIGVAVTPAIFIEDGPGDGRISYYFGLCFSCILPLVYQTAFPLFERTRKFANAYVHAVIDVVCTIFWFAAFIGVAVWVRQGSEKAKGWKSGDRLCSKFDWGSRRRCEFGQGIMVLGIFVWGLFILTTALSVYGVWYYRREGSLPGIAARALESVPVGDQDEGNFSASAYDKFDERGEEQNLQLHRDEGNEHSSLHEAAEGTSHPVRPLSSGTPQTPRHAPQLPPHEGFEPIDTGYQGGRSAYNPPSHQPQVNPFEDYETHHSNESGFVGGLKPLPSQAGHSDPFNYDHRGYGRSANPSVDFPDADYHR